VHEWVERYGDPRDPKVDPIDWVERIPFSETRNYVQRVMENLQVYRVRLGHGSRLMIEADLRRGSIGN
jgi:soluble lytic murein transglycosylase